MLAEFRAFILKGNLLDLAVAFVLGAAFSALVTAAVEDLVTPLIAAVGGEPRFGDLAFTVNGSRFRYGDFLNKAISFLLVGAVLFALVKVVVRLREPEEAPASLRPCPFCRQTVPIEATRCAFCTSELTPLAA